MFAKVPRRRLCKAASNPGERASAQGDHQLLSVVGEFTTASRVAVRSTLRQGGEELTDPHALKAGALYAVRLSESEVIPVKVLDAAHTYTLVLLAGEQTARWLRDEEWTIRRDPVHPQDSHGVLVAGLPGFMWPGSWLRKSQDEQVAALQTVSLRDVLADYGSVQAPVWTTGPERLDILWDDYMAPILKERSEAGERQRQWMAERERETREREIRSARADEQLARLRTLRGYVSIALGLAAVACLFTPVAGTLSPEARPLGARILDGTENSESFKSLFAGSLNAPPFGLLLIACAVVLAIVHAAIVKRED